MRAIGDWMKKHLQIVVETPDGLDITPVCDPFHTTRVVHIVEFSFWDRLKLLFIGKHAVTVRVKLQADDVAIRRWFGGQDCCMDCELPNWGELRTGHYICDECRESRLAGHIRTVEERLAKSVLAGTAGTGVTAQTGDISVNRSSTGDPQANLPWSL